MQRKRIAFIGFGDLAQRAARQLPECDLLGVARSSRVALGPVCFLQGAVDTDEVLARLSDYRPDAVVITLSPDGSDEAAYEHTFGKTVTCLANAMRQWLPQQILLVSSTSVYGQEGGEWVDEHSPAEPRTYQGRWLLSAEQVMQALGTTVSCLRFAGIYGPGRHHLLRMVQAGKSLSDDFSNRIHVDDGAAAIAHLLRRAWQGEKLQSKYVICDDHPCQGGEICTWLAARLGVTGPLTETRGARGGNKRCNNQGLRASGFCLRYPDYRSGYSSLLEAGESDWMPSAL